MINVGIGAAIGAVIRYIITSWWKKLRIDWPLATLFINITGICRNFGIIWFWEKLISNGNFI